MRSAPLPDGASGEGLLPADLLAALFVCHAICELAANSSAAHGGDKSSTRTCMPLYAEAAVASAALLKEALADVPLPEAATLQSGFEALLGRHWPARNSLDRVAGFRTAATRFPGI